jgi:hypothetical protein
MKLILLLTLFIPSIGLSQVTQRSFEALVRNDRNRPSVEEVVLSHLISHDSFDGEFFKIVKGKSENAIGFNDDKALVMRAATVYYHLTIARNYFIDKIKSTFVSKIPKLTIRLEHTNKFNELGHFANDNLDPQYNNALSIPAGEGMPSKNVGPWGTEIWFRPSQKIYIRETNSSSGSSEFLGLITSYRKQIHMQTLQRFLTTSIQAFSSPYAKNPLTIDNLIRTVGSSVIIESSYQLYDPIMKLFTRKWYWLDTAIIPEIIYHEYSHVALSDYLVLSHSTPVIEGMADFFAGQIANSPKLAMHIKKYNTYNGKNALRKNAYNLDFELNDYANTDFVFGLLWEMKKILGQDMGEKFIFNLREKITTNASIRGQLIEGMLKTCDEYCVTPFTDKLRILKAFNKKGL